MGEKNTINYKGMELPCIESGYWPKGVTLVGSDGCAHVFHERKVFYLRDGHAIFDGKEKGTCWTRLSRWAILPEKPAPRRLTNREAHELCQKGWGMNYNGTVIGQHDYPLDLESNFCHKNVVALRAPNTDEWLEPTTDLLEVAK